MGKYYGRWEHYDYKYDDKLSEEENYQKFFDYFNDPNHKNRSWVFEECELTDEIIKEEYDSEIKRLIDIGLIKPPISSFHLHYIGWKEWSHSKSVHPYWSSRHSILKITHTCDLPYEVQRSIKDLYNYNIDVINKQSYRLRENMKELCHLYDNYKNPQSVTVDNLEDNAKRFDLVTLEKNFGDGADTSPIRYALAVKNLTEYLSLKFDEYIAEKADVLAELQKLPAAPKFIPDIKKLRADLNNFHADALKIYSSFIDAENLQGLYNLYKSYPPFSIVAETLTEKIRQVILRVEIFEVMPDFVRGICAEVTKKFNGNDKIKPYFDAVTEIYSNLFIYVLEGHLRQEIVKKAAAERVLEILTTYRKSLDNIKIDPCVKGSSLAEMRESKELNNIQIQGEIARCGKICKNSLKEIEESLTDETEKRWLRINCIEKISG